MTNKYDIDLNFLPPKQVSVEMSKFPVWLFATAEQAVAHATKDLLTLVELMYLTDRVPKYMDSMIGLLANPSRSDDVEISRNKSVVGLLAGGSTNGNTYNNIGTVDFNGKSIGIVIRYVDIENYGDGHEITVTKRFDIMIDGVVAQSVYISCEGIYSSWDSNDWTEAYFVEPEEVKIIKIVYKRREGV